MKRTASLLVLLVAGFVVGCQDGSIMDPTTAATSNEVRLSKPQPVNTLALAAVVREPGNVFNAFVEVSGAADYQMTVTVLDPIPPNPQHAVRLRLHVHAEVRPYEEGLPAPGAAWRASGSSDDLLPIPESGEAFLTKRYQVQGRSDGALLFVSLRMTLTGVEVNRMWLELPSEVRAAERN